MVAYTLPSVSGEGVSEWVCLWGPSLFFSGSGCVRPGGNTWTVTPSAVCLCPNASLLARVLLQLVVTARLLESSSALGLFGLGSPVSGSSKRSTASSLLSGRGKGMQWSKTMGPTEERAKGPGGNGQNVLCPGLLPACQHRNKSACRCCQWLQLHSRPAQPGCRCTATMRF